MGALIPHCVMLKSLSLLTEFCLFVSFDLGISWKIFSEKLRFSSADMDDASGVLSGFLSCLCLSPSATPDSAGLGESTSAVHWRFDRHPISQQFPKDLASSRQTTLLIP